MKEKPTGKASAKRGRTDWERLSALSEKDIKSAVKADPEGRPTDVDFWRQAKIVLPRAKQTVTIRLDADLLARLAAAAERLSDADQRRAANLHGSTEVSGGGPVSGNRVAAPCAV